MSDSSGFRISARDVAVLVLGAGAVWWLQGPMAVLIAIVVTHFFLFCNVFRVWRNYELIWAAVFVINVGVLMALDLFSWWIIVLAQAPATILVVWLQIRSPHYRGVGSSSARNKE